MPTAHQLYTIPPALVSCADIENLRWRANLISLIGFALTWLCKKTRRGFLSSKCTPTDYHRSEDSGPLPSCALAPREFLEETSHGTNANCAWRWQFVDDCSDCSLYLSTKVEFQRSCQFALHDENSMVPSRVWALSSFSVAKTRA